MLPPQSPANTLQRSATPKPKAGQTPKAGKDDNALPREVATPKSLDPSPGTGIPEQSTSAPSTSHGGTTPSPPSATPGGQTGSTTMASTPAEILAQSSGPMPNGSGAGDINGAASSQAQGYPPTDSSQPGQSGGPNGGNNQNLNNGGAVAPASAGGDGSVNFLDSLSGMGDFDFTSLTNGLGENFVDFDQYLFDGGDDGTDNILGL